MSRNAFGAWGPGLTPRDFAEALAAAGVSEGEVVRPRSEEDHVEWALTTPPEAPAEELASRWSGWVAQRSSLRLGVTEWPQDVSPTWIVETLARPEIGTASVFLATVQPRRVAWKWPLEIAVLGPDGAAIAEQLRGAKWVQRFVEVVTTEEARPCDLLLVTRGLRQGLPLVLDAPVRASAVVFLDALTEPWERANPLLDTVFAETHAGAVAFTTAADPAALLNSILYELSHDQPLDVALFNASRETGDPPPLLAADPALLEETRVSRVAGRFAERLATAREETRGRPVAANGGGEARDAESRAIERLERQAADLGDYGEESRDASVLLDLESQARAVVPPPAPRFVQAQVYEQRGGEWAQLYAFRPATLHEIRVRIGPPDKKWTADPTTAFDESSLPPGTANRLQVVLTEPQLLDEPQTAEIILPERGPSSPASFWLQTRTTETPVEARIVVLHEGRVLQTVALRAQVRDDAEAAVEGDLTVSVEALVHPFMGLTGRTPFDAAFVVEADRAGTDRVTAITGKSVDIEEPEDLSVAFKEVTAKLEDLVTAEDLDTIDLRDDRVRELLVFLAVQGRSIYDRLMDVQAGQTIAEMKRIQILSLEPEKLFPLEFAYDGVSPDDDANICPTAEQELATGALETCPARKDPRYVCPLGFWGLRKVIERHAHDPSSKQVPEEDFRVSDWPDEGRKKRLRPFTGALFAASSRVDKKRPETTAELVQRLGGLVGVDLEPAVTWTEWQQGVESSSPPLLVILPHTLPHPKLKVPTMEIGQEQLVRFDKIDATYVGAQWPIVFLLGCETSEAPIEFQKFPTQFRRQQAGVVVATLTRVLGRNAGPVAGELVAAFAEESKNAETTVGEVLRRVRCTLLAKGYPTVLTVVAFGDADWIFQPQEG